MTNTAVRATRLATLAALGLAVFCAQAQTVYRIVGPDGKVTFSDQPPPGAAPAPAPAPAAGARPGARRPSAAEVPSASAASSNARAQASGGGADTAGLPFDLRQSAQRFPVVLYTSKDCNPCQQGRALLAARGIPYSEKTVSTGADAEALKRLSGDNSLPYLTVGGSGLKGFSEPEWTKNLDAAGYPETSQLPRTYAQPAPTPLVPATVKPSETAAAATADAPAPTPAPAAPPVSAPMSNPAGIRF